VFNPLTISLFFQSGEQGGSTFWTFVPFIAIFVIMYLLILRPQAKKQKQHQMMISGIKKGDKVVTAGGIHGTVVGIKEKENILVVKIDENVKVELNRSSVAQKVE
jgi:preprotein translocase subunit YajC